MYDITVAVYEADVLERVKKTPTRAGKRSVQPELNKGVYPLLSFGMLP